MDKFERDICIHKCISFECYEDIYQNIESQIEEYRNPDEKELARVKLKNQFQECIMKFKIGDSKYQPYSVKRAVCSKNDCSHINKNL